MAVRASSFPSRLRVQKRSLSLGKPYLRMKAACVPPSSSQARTTCAATSAVHLGRRAASNHAGSVFVIAVFVVIAPRTLLPLERLHYLGWIGGLRSTVQVDAFESLLSLAGLDNMNELPPRDAPLTPQEAARVLAVLLSKPVTLGSFPPRMAACHLLREVLEGGEVSREELLRRVERFRAVAVLRPDGYLAWTLNGRTQQRVGPVRWKDEAFRAGPFELGRFYTGNGWVFRLADMRLRPIMDGPALAEVYDDADYLGRTLNGAEEAFVELYHAMGQLLSHPTDSIAALQHLPAGVAALLASSPEYLERFRYMTRGEQVKALSKLTTNLIVTFGTAGGTTSTLTRTLGGLEATVPVLSLSAEGLLMVERVAVPVGKMATVLAGQGQPSSFTRWGAPEIAEMAAPPLTTFAWGPMGTESSPPSTTQESRRAAEHGFTRAVVTELKGTPGSYSFIQILFTK
jgi:hypothetical protein